MRKINYLILLIVLIQACNTKVENDDSQKHPLTGTWKLISGTVIQGKDTLTTDYTKGQEMIKIINESHFAFLLHDLNKGLDTNAVFVAGGGKYSLEGGKYIEHLEYCNYREWEGNTFELDYSIQGDTLVTKGVERVEELGVGQVNIERFIRMGK